MEHRIHKNMGGPILTIEHRSPHPQPLQRETLQRLKSRKDHGERASTQGYISSSMTEASWGGVGVEKPRSPDRDFEL